jgi:hypothetical protein
LAAVMIASALASCSTFGGGGTSNDPDAATAPADGGNGGSDAVATDAATPAPCDLTQPFEPPLAIEGLVTGLGAGSPSLTPDELVLLFNAYAPNGDGSLMWSKRTAATAPWPPATVMANVNAPDAGSYSPFITNNSLELYFASTRAGGPGGIDLFIATRPSTVADFGNPATIAGVNTPGNEQGPFLTTYGELWWTSNLQLFRAPAAGDGFAAPIPVTELTAAAEVGPTLSADGLHIFFGSTRTDGGARGHGHFDIWEATRAARTDPFGNLRNVFELNTDGNESTGWLSTDACRLYFGSDRDGTTKLYVAARPRGG